MKKVLIWTNSEGSDKPVHPCGLARTFTVRSHNIGNFKLQAKRQTSGPLDGCACAFEKSLRALRSLLSQVSSSERPRDKTNKMACVPSND